MTLSKETLNKTIELIDSQIKEIESQEKDILTAIRSYKVGNFFVNYVDKSWTGINTEVYEINFKYTEREIDLDFRIYSDLTVNRVNWSSWSFSKVTHEEITKSINYIDAVKEMLTILSDTTVAKEVIEEVVKIKQNELAPLQTKSWDLDKEKREVQNAINEIDRKEQLQKAIELFKKEVFFADTYSITNRNTIRSARVEIKKDKITLYYGYEGKEKKTIKEQDLVWLYNHATKTLVYQNRNWDTNDYNDDNMYKYYQTDNMFLTLEEANNPVRTYITKDEYGILRK